MPRKFAPGHHSEKNALLREVLQHRRRSEKLAWITAAARVGFGVNTFGRTMNAIRKKKLAKTLHDTPIQTLIPRYSQSPNEQPPMLLRGPMFPRPYAANGNPIFLKMIFVSPACGPRFSSRTPGPFPNSSFWSRYPGPFRTLVSETRAANSFPQPIKESKKKNLVNVAE